MPVIKVDNQQFALRPGQTRLGGGEEADVRVDASAVSGIQAIVEVRDDAPAVIRRASSAASVRVNGILLVDPTPLMHGDKVEIAGKELLFAEDGKSGDTAFHSAADIAAMLAAKRSGPARATAPTGGRLVSLVDGKEYAIGSRGIVIGRDASAGVVVPQNEVSRKHAEVAPIPGGYELRDFSANGVFVNGERLEAPMLLSRSDVIRVGTEEFRFYADVRPAAPPPLSPPPGQVQERAQAVSHAGAQGHSAVHANSLVSAPPRDAPVAPPAEPAPERPVLATLEIMNAGPDRGLRFELRTPLAHVGRGAHNDVVLADDSVSETHAKLQRRDDGWYVLDLGSTNGTYVAGQRLGAERRLDGMPDVRFGGMKLLFRPAIDSRPALADTRIVAAADRGVAAAAARHRAPAAFPAPAPVPVPASRGRGAWAWAVVLLALAAVLVFFLMKP